MGKNNWAKKLIPIVTAWYGYSILRAMYEERERNNGKTYIDSYRNRAYLYLSIHIQQDEVSNASSNIFLQPIIHIHINKNICMYVGIYVYIYIYIYIHT